MASTYNYLTKDTMKVSNFTVTNTGGTYTNNYTQSFQNQPVVITSPTDASFCSIILTTSISSISSSSFNTLSYFKDARGGQLGGGPYYSGIGITIYDSTTSSTKNATTCGILNSFSIDSTGISKYKYNGFPILQVGNFKIINTDGTISVNFSTTFNSVPYIVVCPINNTTSGMIYGTITSKSTSGFSFVSRFLDGRNGQNGADWYYSGRSISGVTATGDFNYIAVDNSACSFFKFKNGPVIKAGSFTITDVRGVSTISLEFTSGTTYAFCSVTGVTGNTNQNMPTYSITSISNSQFSVLSWYKDARGGQNGGDLYYQNNGGPGTFDYIAVTN